MGAPSSHAPRARPVDRYVYGFTAVAFAVIVVLGFGRTYFLRPFVSVPPLPAAIVYVHAAVMTLWVALFGLQVWLVAARRVRLHQRLGYAGVGLAAAIVVTGLWTTLRAAKYGSSATPPGFSEPTFSIVPLGDLVMFVLLFGGALLYRRHPATHKRLMLLTVLNFLTPALGRLPFDLVRAAPAATVLGTFLVGIGGTLVLDWLRDRRVDRVFVVAAIVLVASIPLRIALIGTAWWAGVAAWLATLA